MKLPSRSLWFVSFVGVIALLAAACGGDGDGDGEATPGEGETPGVTATELQTDFGVRDTEIVLGQTSVISGNPVAAAFAPIAPAIQAYFAKVNQEDGGVCSRQIRLIVEDDQYAPGPALERARKLVEQDQVLAFVGNLGTAAVSGQVNFINDPNGDGDTSDGIPHLFLSTGAAMWDDPEQWPWTIGYIPDYVSEGNVLATYVNENFPGQTAAILYQNDTFGEEGRAGFKEVFEGEVVAEQSYESTAVDITSQMANLRDADPEIVYLYSIGLATRSAYLYMEENDWHPLVVISYVNPPSLIATLLGGGTEPEQLAAGYPLLEGSIITNFVLDPVADADDPAMVEHVRIMESYGGPTPAFLSLYAQSMGELVVETLTRACDNGDMTRAGVLAAAESIQGFQSSVALPGVEINLSATDHFSIQSLVPSEIQKDGTLVPLTGLIDVEE